MFVLNSYGLLPRIYKDDAFFFRCKCGNCAIDRLANARECKCCTEIKGCISSLTTVGVRQDIGEQTCVVEHPWFNQCASINGP